VVANQTCPLSDNNLSEAKFKLTRDFLKPSRIIGYTQALGNLGLYLFLLWISSQIENGFCLFLMFFLIGISLNRLFFPVHDCIHLSLFPTKKENHICGSILSAYLGTTFEAISLQHFDHHKNIGLPEDPGAPDYYVSFSSRREYLLFIISPLFGSIFLQKIIDYLMRPSYSIDVSTNIPNPKKKISMLLAFRRYSLILVLQLFVCFILTSGFKLSELWRYPLFGVLPAVTVFLFLIRLRMFLEHGSIDYQVSNYLLNKNPITRTIYATTAERILMCGSDFNYHHEHHLYPGVPGYQLPRLHNELLKFNYDPQSVRSSYTESFLELWRNLGINKK
jgi:fatty acid desaturase